MANRLKACWQSSVVLDLCLVGCTQSLDSRPDSYQLSAGSAGLQQPEFVV